jgi:hypothetical protein
MVTLYYRDPDSNLSNQLQLQSAFRTAARVAGASVELRPIGQRQRFATTLRQQTTSFALMPSWFKTGKRRALLVAQRKGQTTFRHVVLVKEGAAPSSGAAQIAGAVDGEYWKKVTAGNVPGSLKGARFIQVPKHLDGIMALSYGQVRYVIVPSTVLLMVRQQFPALLAGTTAFYETEPLSHLSLYAIGNVTRSSTAVTEFLLGLSKKREGRKLLGLLGFDSWVGATGRTSRPGKSL